MTKLSGLLLMIALTVLVDFVGILGGGIVAVSQLDVSFDRWSFKNSRNSSKDSPAEASTILGNIRYSWSNSETLSTVSVTPNSCNTPRRIPRTQPK